MSWTKALAGCVLLAATAAAAVYAAAPATRSATPTLRVKPTSIHRGGRVTFSGNTDDRPGCVWDERLSLYSKLFRGRGGGARGTIGTTVRGTDVFSRVYQVKRQEFPGRYTITAWCGNKPRTVGVVHLRVR